MTTAISNLMEILRAECIRRLPAPDATVAQRWALDDVARFQEGVEINLLNPVHHGLLQEASEEWQERFSRCLRPFGGSETAFAIWFMQLRDTARKTQMLPLMDHPRSDESYIYQVTECSRMVCVNLHWCSDFGLYLRRAIKPTIHNNEHVLATVMGFQMAAAFWLENVAKARDRAPLMTEHTHYDHDALSLLDAVIDSCCQAFSNPAQQRSTRRNFRN